MILLGKGRVNLTTMIKLIKKAYAFIDGNKTYFVAVLAGVVFTAQLLGYVTEELANEIYVYLGLGGVVAFRSAMKKIEK